MSRLLWALVWGIGERSRDWLPGGGAPCKNFAFDELKMHHFRPLFGWNSLEIHHKLSRKKGMSSLRNAALSSINNIPCLINLCQIELMLLQWLLLWVTLGESLKTFLSLPFLLYCFLFSFDFCFCFSCGYTPVSQQKVQPLPRGDTSWHDMTFCGGQKPPKAVGFKHRN